MSETVNTEEGKVKGTTTFGVQGLSNPTPLYITWIFRVQFVINKAILLFFIQDLTMLQVKILACTDFIVWGLGRFVGVKKDQFDA